MKRILIASAMIFGCNIDQPASDFSPADVPTGVYQVTIATDADTCSPARFVGSGNVLLSGGGGQLVLQAYSPTNTFTFTLAADQDYAEELTTLVPCPGQAGDTVSIELALIAATADHVEVAVNQTWELASTCNGGTFNAVVPSTSCGAAQTFTYDLTQACAAPTCTQDPSGSGVPSCACN
jgi:hypothetical protein